MDKSRIYFGNLTSDFFHPTDNAHLFWEAINTLAYELGGVIFIVGSIPFLPAYNEYLVEGVYCFIIGSLLYLIVAVHDTFEVLEAAEEDEDEDEEDMSDQDSSDDDNEQESKNEKSDKKAKKINDGKHFSRETRFRLDLASSLIYVFGSSLFIVGSVVFLPSIQHPKFGALLFIIGSILFAVGALINMVQIFESHDGAAASLLTALLANLTAASYLIGSTMFGVASVPYLFDFAETADANLIYTFLGWNYILGSVAFTIGGTINYVRARILLQDQISIYLSRQKATQQIHELHKQHKEQNYISNQTWGAKSSTLLYEQPNQHRDSDVSDEPDHIGSRVMWKDQQNDDERPVTIAAKNEGFRDNGQETFLTDGVTGLMDLFQVETASDNNGLGSSETTSLLSDPPSSTAGLSYGSSKLSSNTLSSTTTAASSLEE